MHFRYPVSFLAGKYDRDRFYEMAKGLEEVREGGSRCMGCYELRLKESAEIAVAGGFDYFTTTLSISQDYCGCEFSYKARQAEKCV